VPFFEDYTPDAHGSPHRRLVVRQAVSRDVPALAAIARTRGPQPAQFDGRVAAWVADDERRVTVAGLRDEPGPADGDGTADRPGVGARGSCADVEVGAAERVAGWAMAARCTGHDDAPDGWYVSWLVVDPSWRRRGVATALLDDLLTWTSSRGGALFSLVNTQNRASLDLHVQFGFREIACAGAFAGVTFTGGAGLLLEARTR
jgi:GNAT superfamily N-acetyltransferase